jgi:hypothetical protein
MVYLTMNGGTEIKSFNTKKERQEYCEKRGMLMFSQDNPLFTREVADNIRKHFPFLVKEKKRSA